MADQSHSLFHISPFDVAESSRAQARLREWIMALTDDNLREEALNNLIKNKDIHEGLAPLLWNTSGVIFALLRELMGVYRHLSTQNLTQNIVKRVCNVLFLFKCLASHRDTRKQFITAEIPSYIYPLLSTTHTDRPHEYLRLSGLGVIGCLAKDGDEEVIQYLLNSELTPNCFRSMEVGVGQSKVVAAFILRNILMHDVGLRYFCLATDKFSTINNCLENVTRKILEEPSKPLLKYVVSCYLKLSEYSRPRNVFRASPHMSLRNNGIFNLLQDDTEAFEQLQQFFNNVHSDLPL